ncbi:hypothetical protein lerEdw1_008876 [Lerista edwardsae]|nr:hypothetical protein lerEdw1_008876 [Lerista edwardsae]
MADDLDELLDEVENKFCRLPGSECSEGVREQQEKKSHLQEKEKAAEEVVSARISKDAHEEEDIDEIIKDIIDEKSFAKNPVKPFSKSPNSAFENNKANNITSTQARGKRTCDQLRCTGCDFHVSHFNDYQWDQSCDYLFFRNNMPEFSKLRTKMLKKTGTRAYACQCSWRSIDELTDLSMDRQLRWVCSKHIE